MLEGLKLIPAYWADGGLLLLPIAAVALAIWTYLLRLRNGLRCSLRGARAAEAVLDAWLTERMGRDAALARLHGAGDRISHAVGESLRLAAHGKAARERFDDTIRREAQLTRRDIVVLKALTAAAPLLGLLGTVSGMVTTFTAVAGQGADNARLVAGGISAALITTQYGLMAALPGVFGLLHLNHLRERLHRMLGTIGMLLYVGLKTNGPRHV